MVGAAGCRHGGQGGLGLGVGVGMGGSSFRWNGGLGVRNPTLALYVHSSKAVRSEARAREETIDERKWDAGDARRKLFQAKGVVSQLSSAT